jgi:hypothetical protein
MILKLKASILTLFLLLNILNATGQEEWSLEVVEPSLYHSDFLTHWNWVKPYTVRISKDSIIVNNEIEDPIIIPTDLPENKQVQYMSQSKQITYRLSVCRVNYTDVLFEISGFSQNEVVYNLMDTAYLLPSFYNASDGTIEDENGNVFGLNNFFYDSDSSSGSLFIPDGFIEFIGFKNENGLSIRFYRK